MPPSIYLWLLIALMCVVSVGIVLPFARSRIAGVREAIWANIFVILGALTIVMQGRMPVLAGVLIPNGFIAGGAACLIASISRLMGRRPPWRILLTALVALLAIMSYYASVEPNLACRVIAMSMYLIGIVLSAAWLVWSSVRKNMQRLRYSHLFMISLGMLLAVAHAVRIYVYATGSSQAVGMLGNSAWHLGFLAMSVFSGPGLMIGLAMMFYDHRLVEREYEASTDFLTGLLLRKAWWERTEALGALAHRNRQPLMVLLIDMDDFKRINDTHGHAGGDAVLRHFALQMLGTLRKSDALGRLGGEEFVLALPGAGPEQARSLADRLREMIAHSPCHVEGEDIRYTLSAGLAGWREGETLQAALERADRALYRAKLAGRNRVEVD